VAASRTSPWERGLRVLIRLETGVFRIRRQDVGVSTELMLMLMLVLMLVLMLMFEAWRARFGIQETDLGVLDGFSLTAAAFSRKYRRHFTIHVFPFPKQVDGGTTSLCLSTSLLSPPCVSHLSHLRREGRSARCPSHTWSWYPTKDVPSRSTKTPKHQTSPTRA